MVIATNTLRVHVQDTVYLAADSRNRGTSVFGPADVT